MRITAAFMATFEVVEVEGEDGEVAEEDEASATEANVRDETCKHAANTRQKTKEITDN